jgi:hypothetical protein
MTGVPRFVRGAILLVAAAVALAAAGAAGAAWWLGLVTWERHTGYLAPAFARDGRAVYAMVRDTRGVTWGFGWEHFTPPAHAYPLADRVRLVRLDVASGAEETLETWGTTPVTRRLLREYRGRVFNFMSARVRVEPDGSVHYAATLAIPVVPVSEVHRLGGVWSTTPGARRRGEWSREGWASDGPSEPVLSGPTEVFALPGPEGFPCAVALLDHRTRAVRVLARSAAFAARYPGGPSLDALLAVSRKADIERVEEVRRVKAELVAKYRGQGLSEGDAILRSLGDLEDRGYLPRSPRLVAHRLAGDAPPPAALPVFEIADAEMASGIFPDLERALARPGAEVRKSTGAYVVHRDYGTSQRLNAYLERGGREFLVRFRGARYRVEVRS